MFTSGNGGSARQTAWEAELEIREAVREAVRNSSSPTVEDLVRSHHSGIRLRRRGAVRGRESSRLRASLLDPVALYNATARAELHLTQSLEKIEQLEGELENLTRMVRDLRTAHEVLTKALEAHKAKIRALHTEEEEELLYHFLQKGNAMETFIEFITHGEGMVRVTTDRDEFFFAPMRSGKKKRFNIFRPDKRPRTILGCGCTWAPCAWSSTDELPHFQKTSPSSF
ncbi:unnamed protein product [Cylicocyclus nassatus]|uniref:Uncharacterized protein n=1 Tax=Cylicocyclus nassatus TaxID=53992 RepID=A0AA36M539_CYLNA|nr:unnamed protein product [Cylicocyclus nassatus]